MENLSPTSWVPIAIFAVLGLNFLDKSLRSKAKRRWAWGRTEGSAPISRGGYFILAVTFLDIGAMLAWSPGAPPTFLIILLGFCFLASLVIGFVDTRAYRRRLAGGGKREG